MRIPHYLRKAPSGRWMYYQRVPLDLVGWFGRRWIKHTLPTTDRCAAQVGALAYASGYALAFGKARAGAMSKDEEKALRAGLRALYSGTADTFKIKNGPHGPELETDGTEADAKAGAAVYGQALEAWERVERAKAETAAQFNSEAYQRAVASINAPVPSVAKGPTLAEAFDLYFATEGKAKGVENRRKRSAMAAVFSDFAGASTRVDAITTDKVAAWVDQLQTASTVVVRKNGKQRIKPPVSKLTARNYASHLRQIWNWLKARRQVSENPFEGIITVKKSEKDGRRDAGHIREPFDGDQLRTIFSPANLTRTRMEHVRWGALVGLYTGARLGEVAQIYLRDFVNDGGVPCVKITNENEGQRLKTKASKRLVPIHPDLIRLGLLEHVTALRAAGEEQLFAITLRNTAGVGATLGEGFSNYIARIGIKPKKSAGTVGFHSLRPTMTQALQGRADVPAERRRAYMGHDPGEDVHATHYMRPWTPEELAAVHKGITWGDWLDFDGLRGVLSSGRRGHGKRSHYATERAAERAKAKS